MSQKKEKVADEVMKTVQQRLNESKDATKGWGKMVQQIFSDIGIGYRLKFAKDGTVTMEKVKASEIRTKDAAATVTVDVDTMKDLIDGKLPPMEAMGTGKIKVDGDMTALLKLLPAFG
ncbi:MAG: SCP2 sterol-binding domain-containing protein [Candidatus Atabeyarchaeum deiterrae]